MRYKDTAKIDPLAWCKECTKREELKCTVTKKPIQDSCRDCAMAGWRTCGITRYAHSSASTGDWATYLETK